MDNESNETICCYDKSYLVESCVIVNFFKLNSKFWNNFPRKKIKSNPTFSDIHFFLNIKSRCAPKNTGKRDIGISFRFLYLHNFGD